MQHSSSHISMHGSSPRSHTPGSPFLPRARSAVSSPLRNSFAPSARMQTPVSDPLELAALYHPPLHPLQYNTIAPAPFRRRPLAHQPYERSVDDLFMPQNLRKELAMRNEAVLQILPASNLPEFVHVYHSLMPLDLGNGHKDTQVLGKQVQRYKATSHQDGRTYCLLRIDDFEVTSESEHQLQIINRWKRVNSSCVVGVVEAFTTTAFARNLQTTENSENAQNSQSLVVVYEYWPLAKRLSELDDADDNALWSIAFQVFSALQTIHRRMLAVRGLVNEDFILLTSQNRVRLGSLGVPDLLKPAAEEIEEEQAKDYIALAELLRTLDRNAGSQTLIELAEALEARDISKAETILGPQSYRIVDSALGAIDSMEQTLSNELENGRLVRLLAKLEYVLTDADLKPTSERYPLTLFREYVFHQHTPDGKPSLNLAHALTALNKLDAGVDESVLLTSKDGATRVVVTYKELKVKFGYAFDLLVKAQI